MKALARLIGFGALLLLVATLTFSASGDTGSGHLFVSSTSGGSVGGVVFGDEDVLGFDPVSGVWSLYVDGSDLGLPVGAKLDGFHVRSDGGVLFSLTAPVSLPGVGLVDDSDVVELVPSSVGVSTVGELSLFFDGSLFGLSSAGEDVDAVGLTVGGELLVSLSGSGSGGFGFVGDEDVLVWDGVGLSLFLDGSAVGLGSASEDIVGISVGPAGAIHVSTLGNVSVPGVTGDRSDVLSCAYQGAAPFTSCDWSVAWDGGENGFGAESLNGLSTNSGVTPPTSTSTSTTTTSTSTSTTTTGSTTTTTGSMTTSTTGSTTTSTTTTTTTTSTSTTLPPNPAIVVEPGTVFVSSTSGGSVGGVVFGDEDVLGFDPVSGVWSLYVDGSDLGLPVGAKLDGFHVRSDGGVLFSLTAPVSLPGVGLVDDSDVVELVPSSVGVSTVGELSLFFDGSLFGLSSAGEDVDAVGLTVGGELLVSLSGSGSGGFGFVGDEDVLVWDGVGLSLFLDGSAVGLGSASEDIVGIDANPDGTIQLSTLGNHNVSTAAGNLTGGRSNILTCTPTSAGPITSCDWTGGWSGPANSFGAESVNGFSNEFDGYYNDFGSDLGPEWVVYDSIGHAGWGLRRPSAVAVGPHPEATAGGMLTITAQMGSGDEAGQLVSGGLKLIRPQTYGRYTFRVRVEPDPDDVTSGVLLLWPESLQWPRDGEIDIMETWDARMTRTPVESFLHWLDPAATPPYTPADDLKRGFIHPGIDGSQWHIFQLEWREDLLTLSIDGGEPRVLSTDPAEIPDWNMEPTMQLDAFDSHSTPGQQPTMTGTVTMYVDYIIVEP